MKFSFFAKLAGEYFWDLLLFVLPIIGMDLARVNEVDF